MRLPSITQSLKASSLRLAFTTLVSVLGLSLPPISQISFKNHSFSPFVLAQTPQEFKAQADQLLAQGIQQFNNNQIRAAIASWQQALPLYREISDRPGEGNALNNLALAYTNLGENANAIEYYQQSLTIARSLGDRTAEGKILINLGIAYDSLNEYVTAIQYYQHSLEIFQSLDERILEAVALDKLATAYKNLEDYASAIESYQQSLTIFQILGNRTFEAMTLDDLGMSYRHLGDYASAIEYHQQSLAIAREIGDRTLEAKALMNLGIADDSLGNYATAIDYYQQSLTIARNIGDRTGEGAVLGNLGRTYNDLGEYDTAIAYYQQSLAIAREIGARTGEGAVLGNLGNTYNDLGEYDTALEYHQQSLTIAQEIGDRIGEATSLNGLATAYTNLGNDGTAIDYYQQSLTIAQEIGDRALQGNVLNNLGNAYHLLGEYKTAIEYHQQSLTIAQEIGDRALQGNVLNNLGSAFFNAAQLSEAETVLHQGIEAYETIREHLGENDAWKVAIFEEQARTYRLLQKVLIAQNQVEKALEISERGRARAFVELIAQRLATDSEIAVKVELPNLAKIKQVAQQQNAILVEYALIFDEFLYIWVIQTSGEITFRSVNLTQSEIPLAVVAERGRLTASTSRIRGLDETETFLTEMVRGTRDSIGNGTVMAQTTTPQPRINRNLQQLHQLLIEPIADLLPTDPNQKVIFIPQDSLFLVPFAALQDETGKYLIEKHTILTAPAIQVLELTQQQPISNSGEILIVGNPTMPEVSLAANQPPQQLTPLPGTEEEANAIASLLNAQTLIGDRATETIIKQKMPSAKLIHLATHGLLEETDNGILAAIALTPSNSDDGLLTPDEILGLDLNADLVVLSACDTGIGKITGDGVVGLSRSILTAGARSAVVSLWKVPDAQTAVLMGEFYRQWQETGNKAQALRQAMLTTMEQYPHPMNWAAFTIMGESD